MTRIEEAAQVIREATAIVLTSGAGMGVDSGLPDFRGEKGFWNAYPLYEKLGLNFMDCANVPNFINDPTFGWGFYGSRAELYRTTEPHPGFQILKQWTETLPHFVVTSNVDGHFQKAGFDPNSIYEIHGSIHHLQCIYPECNKEVWDNTHTFEVDFETMRSSDFPVCPNCGRAARPNILLFNDFFMSGHRLGKQRSALYQFAEEHDGPNLVVIEMGAGLAIPSIRDISESMMGSAIRINPRDSEIDYPHISLPMGALEALQAIDNLM